MRRTDMTEVQAGKMEVQQNSALSRSCRLTTGSIDDRHPLRRCAKPVVTLGKRGSCSQAGSHRDKKTEGAYQDGKRHEYRSLL
jgi:hypothetical protein